MCLLYFYLTIYDRVENLVSYESMGRAYKYVMRDCTQYQPKYASSANIKITEPMLISQD